MDACYFELSTIRRQILLMIWFHWKICKLPINSFTFILMRPHFFSSSCLKIDWITVEYYTITNKKWTKSIDINFLSSYVHDSTQYYGANEWASPVNAGLTKLDRTDLIANKLCVAHRTIWFIFRNFISSFPSHYKIVHYATPIVNWEKIDDDTKWLK